MIKRFILSDAWWPCVIAACVLGFTIGIAWPLS